MSQIILEKPIFEQICSNRKMLLKDIQKQFDLSVNENQVMVSSIDILKEISEKMAIPVGEFFHNKMDDTFYGIKMCRNDEGYSRISERNHIKYYTYKHLVTTKSCSNLMALKVTVHNKDKDKIELNDGHDSKEMIYVTKGQILMHWKHMNKMHQLELDVGDSIYINPGIPHSFISLIDESELIAFNF